jgi:hypothetical protein
MDVTMPGACTTTLAVRPAIQFHPKDPRAAKEAKLILPFRFLEQKLCLFSRDKSLPKKKVGCSIR